MKRIITTRDDLPKRSFPTKSNVGELLAGNSDFVKITRQACLNAENDLADFDIQDKYATKILYERLLNADLLAANCIGARKHIERIRQLEEKVAAREICCFVEQAVIWNLEVRSTESDDGRCNRMLQDALVSRLRAMPVEEVRDGLREIRGNLEIFSENIIHGFLERQIGPAIRLTGTIREEQADMLIKYRALLTRALPLRQLILSCLTEYLKRNVKETSSIWPEREILLTAENSGADVRIGIWDSGVDVRLFRSASAGVDGKPVGIAFDREFARNADLLAELDFGDESVSTWLDYLKGYRDMRLTIDSEEAAVVRQMLSRLSADSVPQFIERLLDINGYAHGTHVASIASAGNPFAVIVPARMTFDFRQTPAKPSMELAHQEALMYREITAFYREHGVRVVNISWGRTRKSVQAALQANGLPAPDAFTEAARIFPTIENGLHAAISDAPDVLFIASAGNDDNNIGFEEYLPAAFSLPNLITVGAADCSGQPARFTGYGATVDLYARGVEVIGLTPGGGKINGSGTSMAAPVVCNLAAKILALAPTLTVREVVDLLRRGAEERTDGERPYRLLHPQRSLSLIGKRK